MEQTVPGTHPFDGDYSVSAVERNPLFDDSLDSESDARVARQFSIAENNRTTDASSFLINEEKNEERRT